jgi:transcriptional regulator with XRE-family HTH domain
MTSYNRYVAQEVLRLRRLNDIKLEEAARAANLPCDTVKRIEAGTMAITVGHIDKLAEVYKLPACVILQNATFARDVETKRPRESLM